MLSTLAIQGFFLQFLSLDNLYYQWESAGVFDFLLPVLLIFAVIFGVLTSTNILGKNRGVNFIIAVVIALMAIRLNFVSEFFSLIFPSLGIGIAILLVVLIMVGLFIHDKNISTWFNILGYGALAIGIIIAVVVLNQFQWFGSFWWQNNWVTVLWIVIIGLILAPLLLPKKEEDKDSKVISFPIKNLR